MMATKQRRGFSIEQSLLACFVLAAIGSLALSRNSPLAWVLAIPCVRSLFWRLPRISVQWSQRIRYAAYVALAAALVLGLLNKTYPVISDEAARRPLLVAGYGLAVFASLFLLGAESWRPADTLFPSALGIFSIAAINPVAPYLHGMLAIAGFSAFAYLVIAGRGIESWKQAVELVRGQIVRLAVAALAIAVIAGSIIQILPWLQVRVVQATNRIVQPQTDFYAGFSSNSTLGDLEELHLSQKVVMRIWTSRPQKLRGRVFTQFDGRTWHAVERAYQDLKPVSATALEGLSAGTASPQSQDLLGWLSGMPGNNFALPGRDLQQGNDAGVIRTRIVQTVFNDGLLVSPGSKVLVRLAAPCIRVDGFQNLGSPPSTFIQIYGVINHSAQGVVQSGPEAEALTRNCLGLPDSTDPRLKGLAQSLAAGTQSPSERLQKTVSYLQAHCHYSLKVGAFHSQQPVAEFLFEKKQGYCEYFASAAAVLLRLENVPARYVTGFNVQDENREGSHYVVREADAHAWVEAYLPDRGWVEIDPTPEAEYAALHADLRNGSLGILFEGLAAKWAELSARISQLGWSATLEWVGQEIKAFFAAASNPRRLVLFFLFGVLLAGAVVWVKRRRRIGMRPTPPISPQDQVRIPPELLELVCQLDQKWAESGFARPVSRAPLEHWQQIPAGKQSPSFRDCSRRIIDFIYLTCFAGVPFDPSEARHLQASLSRTALR